MLIPAATRTRSPAPIPIDSLNVVEPAALVCRDAGSPVAVLAALVFSAKGTMVTDVIVLTAPLEKVLVKTSVEVVEEEDSVVVLDVFDDVEDLEDVSAVVSAVVWAVDVAVVCAMVEDVETIVLVVRTVDTDDAEVDDELVSAVELLADAVVASVMVVETTLVLEEAADKVVEELAKVDVGDAAAVVVATEVSALFTELFEAA